MMPPARPKHKTLSRAGTVAFHCNTHAWARTHIHTYTHARARTGKGPQTTFAQTLKNAHNFKKDYKLGDAVSTAKHKTLSHAGTVPFIATHTASTHARLRLGRRHTVPINDSAKAWLAAGVRASHLGPACMPPASCTADCYHRSAAHVDAGHATRRTPHMHTCAVAAALLLLPPPPLPSSPPPPR